MNRQTVANFVLFLSTAVTAVLTGSFPVILDKLLDAGNSSDQNFLRNILIGTIVILVITAIVSAIFSLSLSSKAQKNDESDESKFSTQRSGRIRQRISNPWQSFLVTVGLVFVIFFTLNLLTRNLLSSSFFLPNIFSEKSSEVTVSLPSESPEQSSPTAQPSPISEISPASPQTSPVVSPSSPGRLLESKDEEEIFPSLSKITTVVSYLTLIYFSLGLLIFGLQEALGSILELPTERFTNEIQSLLLHEAYSKPTDLESFFISKFCAHPLIRRKQPVFYRKAQGFILFFLRKPIKELISLNVSSEILAIHLLETSGLLGINHAIGDFKLTQFIKDQTYRAKIMIKNSLMEEQVDQQILDSLVEKLEDSLIKIRNSYVDNFLGLEAGVLLIQETLIDFVDDLTTIAQSGQNTGTLLVQFRSDFDQKFSDKKRAVLLNRIIPNLTEIIALIRLSLNSHDNEKEKSSIWQFALQDDKFRYSVAELEKLPRSLGWKIVTFAEMAKRRDRNTEPGINEIYTEVKIWFDQSIDHALVSYSRHNQMLAFILSFVVSISANINTLHIINQLSGKLVSSKAFLEILLGWLLSAFAIFMSVFFWHNLSNRFFGIRSTRKSTSH